MQHLTDNGLSPHDRPRMYVKTAVLIVWFGLSYVLLVFAATTMWEAIPLALSLAFAMGASASESSTTPTTTRTRIGRPSTV